MLSNIRWPAVAILSTVISAGCVGTTTGNPKPQTSGTSIDAAPEPAPSQKTLPPRPRELPLNGVDPCQFWTAEQLQQLTLAPAPRTGTTTAGDSYCSFDESTDDFWESFHLQIVPVLDHEATDVYYDGNDVVDVAGFPAIRNLAPGGAAPCAISVDVAQGQFLEVVFHDRSTNNRWTAEQACELTTRAATMAVQTLASRR